MKKKKDKVEKMKKKKEEEELTEKEKRENRIKKEVTRLTGIYKELPIKEKKILEGLIKRAAYMRIQLEDFEDNILEYGSVEMFSQSENQDPYERERPTARLYNTLNASYQKIMKQLSDFVHREPPKEKDDGFEKFVNKK